MGRHTRSAQSADRVFQRRIMMSAMTFFDATLVQALIANYGYSAVFVVVMLESSGFPVPGETVLVCASIYAGSRHGLSIGEERLLLDAERALATRQNGHLETGGREGQSVSGNIIHSKGTSVGKIVGSAIFDLQGHKLYAVCTENLNP